MITVKNKIFITIMYIFILIMVINVNKMYGIYHHILIYFKLKIKSTENHCNSVQYNEGLFQVLINLVVLYNIIIRIKSFY